MYFSEFTYVHAYINMYLNFSSVTNSTNVNFFFIGKFAVVLEVFGFEVLMFKV